MFNKIDIIVVEVYYIKREFYMGKKTVVVMPEIQRILEIMGNQIKMARLRRKHTNRIQRIIELAIANKVEVLILGVFGCRASG